MNSQICLTPSSQQTIFQGDDSKETASSSRYCINWDKVIVFANSALLVTGIAIAYFMKLPLLMAGLGAYGTVYLMLKPLAERQQSLIADERRERLGQQVESLEEQVEKLDAKQQRYTIEAIEAKQKRNERLTDEELEKVTGRSIAVARGQAAVEWMKREMPKAERDDPSLHGRLKELFEAMRRAGRSVGS